MSPTPNSARARMEARPAPRATTVGTSLPIASRRRIAHLRDVARQPIGASVRLRAAQASLRACIGAREGQDLASQVRPDEPATLVLDDEVFALLPRGADHL